MTQTFKTGDLVWAKLGAFPWWPSRVEDENNLAEDVLDEKQEGHIPVYFFGSHNYGWVSGEENLKTYKEHKEQFQNIKKTKQFVLAMRELEDPSIRPENKPAKQPKKRVPKPEKKAEPKKQTPQEKILYLRSKLQRFLLQTDERTEDDFVKADEKLREVEQLSMDVALFKETKIGKVIKMLSKKDLKEHNISQRCKSLYEKWKKQLEGLGQIDKEDEKTDTEKQEVEPQAKEPKKVEPQETEPKEADKEDMSVSEPEPKVAADDAENLSFNEQA